MSTIIHEHDQRPGATPPPWVQRGPDDQQNYDGPATSLRELGIDVNTSWSPAAGPKMWLDAALYKDRDITPAAARRLALGLLQAADLVESATPPAADGPEPAWLIPRQPRA